MEDELMIPAEDDSVMIHYPTLMYYRMRQLKVSYAAIGKMLGIDRRTIFRYAHGERQPRYDEGIMIAKMLRINPVDYPILFTPFDE